MKRVLAIVLSLLLILTGCQPVPDDATDGTTTVPETTDTIPSSDPEETTEPIPSSGPEETTEPIQETTVPPLDEGYLLERAMGRYSLPPDGISYFHAGNIDRFSAIYGKVDDTGLQKGAYYSYHEALDQCFLIASGTYGDREETKDHAYFVPMDEPNRLYRSDYFGKDRELLYESDNGPISKFSYYGTDSNGKILLNEARSRAVLVDISTGQTEVLMERKDTYNFWFQYFPDDKAFALVWMDDEGYWGKVPVTDEEGKDLFLG